MKAAQNSQRWAIDQRRKARAAFAAQQEPADVTRDRRLAELRQMAAMMETMPHMAESLAKVRAEIAKLESNPTR